MKKLHSFSCNIFDFFKLLSEIFEEVSIQSESAGKLDYSNQAALDEVDTRNKNLEKTHQEQMKDRSEYLKRLEKQLSDYLELNKELASRYRYLKYYLFYHKLALMRTVESKLSSYSGITDKLQLKSLQDRMHHSLKDYLLYKRELFVYFYYKKYLTFISKNKLFDF